MVKTKTALVVDDSHSMRIVISAILRDAGYEVRAAENGQEALSLARLKAFSVVITDINMPVMDGITLVSKLRSLPTYKNVPILTLTTDGTAERKSQGRVAGATGWIVKPLNEDNLLAALDRLIA